MSEFSTRVTLWQQKHGRHDLPWQGADAYRVWLSEIMLQQTQVATVIPYYLRFLASFPNINTLAVASIDVVLAHWSGLGYYARGRNLHRAAKIVVEKFDGHFPNKFEQILDLPGIGRSTAAAICALAYHQRRAILDGNVKRVLARYCGVEGWTGNKQIEAQLWQQAESLLPLSLGEQEVIENQSEIATYTQALMDMGATICTRSKPKCGYCPVQGDCVALQTMRVAKLPTPRVRKTVPEKNATFLLLIHGNDILLEKRAPQGIWGGMWCLPQIEDGDGVVVSDYVLRAGVEVMERKDMDGFTHTFTHFKLHISPVLLRVASKFMRVEQGESVWLDVEEALNAAIPTPVRILLNRICLG